MKYRKKFSIEYLNNFLSDKKNNAFEAEYIVKVPNKLYGFRAFTENDLNAIQGDYIGQSLASELDDIKDATIKYSFRSQKSKILDTYFDWYPFILQTELKKKYLHMDLSRLSVSRGLIDEYRNKVVNKNNTYNRNNLRGYMFSKGIKKSEVL